MAIDTKNLEQQISNLKIMRNAFEKAIVEAEDKLKRLNAGEPIEKVFKTDRRPSDQSHKVGGG